MSAGAGTGAEIVTLGHRFPFWRFVAVDASSEMLVACRQRLSGEGLVERVEFFNGLMQQYRPSTPLDGASSIFVTHFIKNREDKLAYLRSVAESLKPGGLFVLADLFGDEHSSEFARLFDVWFASYESHGVSAEDLARDRAHVMNDVSFIAEKEIHALLLEAGFSPPIRFYQTYLFGGWVTNRVV